MYGSDLAPSEPLTPREDGTTTKRRSILPSFWRLWCTNQFETIHPFQDENGRVGRLLLINALIKHGLPPLNIELKNRKQYYEALREYQTNGNLRPMLDLMLEEHRRLKLLSRGDYNVRNL